jgi:hypothetical protein
VRRAAVRTSVPQPVTEVRVSEKGPRLRLELGRHQDPHLYRVDPALERAHVTVGHLVRDALLREEILRHREDGGIVRADQFWHTRILAQIVDSRSVGSATLARLALFSARAAGPERRSRR